VDRGIDASKIFESHREKRGEGARAKVSSVNLFLTGEKVAN